MGQLERCKDRGIGRISNTDRSDLFDREFSQLPGWKQRCRDRVIGQVGHTKSHQLLDLRQRDGRVECAAVVDGNGGLGWRGGVVKAASLRQNNMDPRELHPFDLGDRAR